MKKYIFSLVLLAILVSSVPMAYCSGEFDVSTVVSSVTDGDTFEATSEGTVRLADVDAPEYYE
jgi:endonuclease YncB( thermonuclease family)